MAKPSTYPVILDRALQIKLSTLKGLGFLEPGSERSGPLIWSVEGKKIAGIWLKVNMGNWDPHLILKYNYNDEPREYRIHLEAIPSNLGKGSVYYFVCPLSFKRCRTLYDVGGYFVHREAHPNCMYSYQAESKFNRGWRNYSKIDRLIEQLNSKYFKESYNGVPTRRSRRIWKRIYFLKERLPTFNS